MCDPPRVRECGSPRRSCGSPRGDRSYHRSSGLVANIPLRSVVYRTRLGGWLRTLLMRPTAASSAAGPPLDGGGVGYGTLFGRSEHRHTRIEHDPGRNIPVEVPTVRAAAAGKVPR